MHRPPIAARAGSGYRNKEIVASGKKLHLPRAARAFTLAAQPEV
jgi:hypothetical protein